MCLFFELRLSKIDLLIYVIRYKKNFQQIFNKNIIIFLFVISKEKG
jgi:hypothetical protein